MGQKIPIKYKERLTKEPTIFITAIHVDNFAQTITVVSEMGTNTHSFFLTMEECQRRGFINFEAVRDILGIAWKV